jgi:hypothetical protein
MKQRIMLAAYAAATLVAGNYLFQSLEQTPNWPEAFKVSYFQIYAVFWTFTVFEVWRK